jgi:HK97 family phage portal protein
MSFANRIFQRAWSMARRTDSAAVQSAGRALGGSMAGVQVTEETALKVSSLYRGVCLLADTVAGLRWDIFDEDNEGRLEKNTEHPLRLVLNRKPNLEMPAFHFRRTMTLHMLVYGNAYAEIEKDNGGHVIGLWIISPERVTAKRDARGNLYYEVRNGMSEPTQLSPDRVFHLRGLSADGITGYSLVALANESLGLGLAMEQFGATFFGNGTNLNGVLETDNKLNPEAYENMANSWNEAHRGVKNSNKVAVLEQGTKWRSTQAEPDKAQFIDGRTFQVVDMCRWLGIPPHKLGVLSDATFSNIEQQNRDFADDAAKPITTVWEQEADFKLLDAGDDVNRKTRMDLSDLYRADLQSMGEFYSKMLQHGIYNINEVRYKLDENDIGTDGDKRFVTVQSVPLDRPAQMSVPQPNKEKSNVS